MVLSLFAVLFAFDAVSGEKESGTLRLVFSNPVPRATFILGKMAGTSLGLILPLAIPLLLGSALLPLMGVPMAPEHWLRLGLVLAAACLYLGGCVGASVCASALTRRPTTTVVVLLVAWILAVLVWPRVSLLAAARTVPAPSLDSIVSQRSRLTAQLRREDMATIEGFWAARDAGQTGDAQTDMAATIARFNTKNQELAAERQRRIQELESRLFEEHPGWLLRLTGGWLGGRGTPGGVRAAIAWSNLPDDLVKLTEHIFPRRKK